MELNAPEVRQSSLARRLATGASVVAEDAAREFGVSADTLRRDLIALEREGRARRVRGGAIAPPSGPMSERLARPVSAALIAATLAVVGDAPTLLLDGGSSVLAVALALGPAPGRLVITPSPHVALACQARGLEVVLIGGTLSGRGGVATGHDTVTQIAAMAADFAVLGACGIDAEFGLSSDDREESAVKRAMAGAAARVLVLAGVEKIGRRARHRTLAADLIDAIVTDAGPGRTQGLPGVIHA